MISNGFDEHVLTGVHAGPPLTDDVLVQALSGSEAQHEPSLGQELEGRGLLRDDGGVVAHRRTRDVRHELDALRGACAIAPSSVHAYGAWP